MQPSKSERVDCIFIDLKLTLTHNLKKVLKSQLVASINKNDSRWDKTMVLAIRIRGHHVLIVGKNCLVTKNPQLL